MKSFGALPPQPPSETSNEKLLTADPDPFPTTARHAALTLLIFPEGMTLTSDAKPSVLGNPKTLEATGNAVEYSCQINAHVSCAHPATQYLHERHDAPRYRSGQKTSADQ